jgi:hypothetical protein
MKRPATDVPRRWRNQAVVLLLVTLLLFLFQIINLEATSARASEGNRLPVSIRAGSEADYSQDPRGYTIPPINEDILNQIITEFPATGSPQDRIGTLRADLSTQVPTMTPDLHLPASFTPTLMGPIFTRAALTPTAFTTPVRTATPYLSLTPVFSATFLTPTPPVFTSTATPQPPTLTATPQPPTLTATPQPPTRTATPKPPATHTPLPPNPTKTKKHTPKPGKTP